LLPTARERATFARARFAGLMARAYPDATLADLCLAVSWLIFAFMLDDHLEIAVGRSPRDQRALADDVLGYLRHGAPPVTLGDPLTGALVDVWTRTRARTGPGWQTRFVPHVAEYLAANAWEADNRRRGRIPPVAEYTRMRRHSAATAMFFDLAEVLGKAEPVSSRYGQAGLALLRRHADNVVAWFNDLVSWPKEAAAGDPHNLVLVVRHELGLSLVEAIRHVVDRHDGEVRAFIAAGAMFRRQQPEMHGMIDALEHWMRANVDWSRESGRYAPAVSRYGRFVARESNNPPRRHQYLFAHRELPMAAFRYGEELVKVARAGNLAEGLAKLWVDLGTALPPEHRLPADGLGASWHEADGYEIALITLPPPGGVTDAYLAAIVVPKGGGNVRYLVLERGVPDTAGKPTTVLGEWLAGGDHFNMGAGPGPEPEPFLAAVCERL
jgi:hypothetical protein